MSRILLVDDTLSTRQSLSDHLSRAGYVVSIADDGGKALEIIRDHEPDLVLLDTDMPGMSGLEVCRRIKQNPSMRTLPVILVTNGDHEDELIDGLDSGADDYITKSCGERILMARIRAALRQKDANERVNAMHIELHEARVLARSGTRHRGDFLAGMSHEIRTPMTAIMGYAEILRNDVDSSAVDPEVAEAADIIHRNGQYLLTMLDDILDLARIEGNQLDINEQWCLLSDLVRDVFDSVRLRAIDKGLQFSCEFSTAVPEQIHTDPIRLKQILTNLIINGITYTDSGHVRLTVRYHHDGDRGDMAFEVEDSGVGIDPDKIETLFEPFSQADVGRRRSSGTAGLGLTLCRRLAGMLGGEVRAQSMIHQGSTFTCILPVCETPPASLREIPGMHADQAITVEDATCDPDPQNLSCRILLAEDSPDIIRLVRFILIRAGASVSVVRDGQSAVEHATYAIQTGRAYDAILMDMQMPVLDGFEATRTLRAKGYDGAIIAITAYTQPGDYQRCMDAGCDGFIGKPISRSELFDTLDTAMRQRLDAATSSSECETTEGHTHDNVVVSRRIFLDMLPQVIADIQEAVHNKDMQRVETLGKSLQANAENLAMTRIADLAGVLVYAAGSHGDAIILGELVRHLQHLAGHDEPHTQIAMEL